MTVSVSAYVGSQNQTHISRSYLNHKTMINSLRILRRAHYTYVKKRHVQIRGHNGKTSIILARTLLFTDSQLINLI